MNDEEFEFIVEDEEVYTANVQNGNVVVEKKSLAEPVVLYRHVHGNKVPVIVHNVVFKENNWTAITDIGEVDIFSEINKTLFKD